MHAVSSNSYSSQSSQSPPGDKRCPVQKTDTRPSLNPLNFMFPNLSQSRATSQKIDLPVERTTSSIPRGDANTNWEYPSPQQMYNAMLRKGFDDTPEDAMEVMVAVHNFLNEGAWQEVEGWEERFSRGLGHGWQICSQGEDSFTHEARPDSGMVVTHRPKLLRFQGRPRELTPKAQILGMLGWAYPSRFG
jgi:cytochrome c heme-lyase